MKNVEEYLQWVGQPVRDKLRNYTGVVTTVSFDVSGCVQAYVIPQGTDKDGKLVDGAWFDVQRLESTGERLVPLPTWAKQPTQEGPNGPAEKSAPRSGPSN